MSDGKRKKFTLLKSQTGLPANIIDIQKYFTAEFGPMQYAEVQNNSNDELEEVNCFWILFSEGEIDGLLWEEKCELTSEEIEKIKSFLVAEERKLIKLRYKNYNLMESLSALENHLDLMRMSFLLRSVDEKMNQIKPLSQGVQYDLNRNFEMVDLLVGNIEQLWTARLENNVLKQIEVIKSKAEELLTVQLKNEDLEISYGIKLRKILNNIIEICSRKKK